VLQATRRVGRAAATRVHVSARSTGSAHFGSLNRLLVVLTEPPRGTVPVPCKKDAPKATRSGFPRAVGSILPLGPVENSDHRRLQVLNWKRVWLTNCSQARHSVAPERRLAIHIRSHGLSATG
jgi:hypothetical protein